MSDWKETARKRKLARQSGDQTAPRRKGKSKKSRGKYVIQAKPKKPVMWNRTMMWKVWQHYKKLEDAEKALDRKKNRPGPWEKLHKYRIGIEERVDGKLIVTPIKGEKDDTIQHQH
jgi:hypothetical protein